MASCLCRLGGGGLTNGRIMHVPTVTEYILWNRISFCLFKSIVNPLFMGEIMILSK